MGNEKAETLTNENLRQILLNKENIAPLEELLAREISKLRRLNKLAGQGKLNFGPVPPEGQLESILAEVKGTVDSFLGVNEVNAPDIEYDSFMRLRRRHLQLVISSGVGAAGLWYGLPKALEGSWAGWLITAVGSGILIRAALEHREISKISSYNGPSETILLARRYRRARRAYITPVIAHEYAHHVQKVSGLNGGEYSIVREGHAMGIASHVALYYSQKEGNEAFLFRTTYGNVMQLKEAYRWLCKELDLNPKKSLRATRSTKGINDAIDDAFGTAVFGTTTHAIGSAAVYLCEAARGPQIYREILQGKLQFAAAK